LLSFRIEANLQAKYGGNMQDTPSYPYSREKREISTFIPPLATFPLSSPHRKILYPPLIIEIEMFLGLGARRGKEIFTLEFPQFYVCFSVLARVKRLPLIIIPFF